MSFGNLDKFVDKTKKYIQKKNITNVSINEYYELKNKIQNELFEDKKDVNMQTIDEIMTRLFNKSLTFNDNPITNFREIRHMYPPIDVPKEYKKLEEHFNTLLATPQPAQRTQEWYDYRYNRITASDTAAAIDLNPYEPVESFILKKCDPNFPFRDNATVFHGKKYEPTATMIYEHMIYNDMNSGLNKETCEVTEFGCMKANKSIYQNLGASPDGICSIYTLDNKFSKRLGVMLEIKCPVSREIHTSGRIAGDVCPFYYYCQVQQQLAVCELNVCDFWQCKLSEYKDRDEFMADKCEKCENTVGYYTEDPKLMFGYNYSKPIKIEMDNRLKKGIILEFFPKTFVPEFDGDNIEWKSKYIYPKRLDMNESQYEEWVINTLNTYKTEYPDIYKDYYFNKIIYWKMESSHNISVKHDEKFMMSILPILNDTWDKIVYYRKNQDKLDELKKIVDERKKYIKINTNYTIHNDSIVKNKYLFLEPNFDKMMVIKGKSYKPVVKDIDSDVDEFIDTDESPKKELIKKGTPKKTIKHTEYNKTKKTGPKKDVPKKLEMKYTEINASTENSDNNDEFID
jgi:putative phage-type endonuclease